MFNYGCMFQCLKPEIRHFERRSGIIFRHKFLPKLELYRHRTCSILILTPEKKIDNSSNKFKIGFYCQLVKTEIVYWRTWCSLLATSFNPKHLKRINFADVKLWEIIRSWPPADLQFWFLNFILSLCKDIL